jgi:toxin FitB
VRGYLLDTNVVSELMQPDPAPLVVRWVDATHPTSLYLSVLTLGELRTGAARLPPSRRRRELEAWIDDRLRPKFSDRILPVDQEVADRWGRLDGEAKRRGRPISILDELLAATALHFKLRLVTRDWKPLVGTGVDVLDPWADG